MWASVRLLKQWRAFTTEIVSTITVVYTSAKTACRVKYPTKKDLARRATLILLVSCGTWESEILVRKALLTPIDMMSIIA